MVSIVVHHTGEFCFDDAFDRCDSADLLREPRAALVRAEAAFGRQARRRARGVVRDPGPARLRAALSGRCLHGATAHGLPARASRMAAPRPVPRPGGVLETA